MLLLLLCALLLVAQAAREMRWQQSTREKRCRVRERERERTGPIEAGYTLQSISDRVGSSDSWGPTRAGPTWGHCRPGHYVDLNAGWPGGLQMLT